MLAALVSQPHLLVPQVAEKQFREKFPGECFSWEAIVHWTELVGAAGSCYGRLLPLSSRPPLGGDVLPESPAGLACALPSYHASRLSGSVCSRETRRLACQSVGGPELGMWVSQDRVVHLRTLPGSIQTSRPLPALSYRTLLRTPTCSLCMTLSRRVPRTWTPSSSRHL